MIKSPSAPPASGAQMHIVRDPTIRVRQAVRDNNVPLLARLQTKTDLRNMDKARLTSLSWAAIEGSLEVFEWLLLDYGHDDQELSRDSDNNTVLHLLASIPSPPTLSSHMHLLLSSPFFPPRPSTRPLSNQIAICLRMTQLYHTLFPFVLDWSNSGGKTALHVAAQAGNSAFINLLCDFGADVDLTDLQGNTPLHYASAWGHIETIKVLLERGSQFASRNVDGFTASDFAYSNTVMGSLQSMAREAFEERRNRRKAEVVASEARGGGGGVTGNNGGLEGRLRSGSASTNRSFGSGSAISSTPAQSGFTVHPPPYSRHPGVGQQAQFARSQTLTTSPEQAQAVDMVRNGLRRGSEPSRNRPTPLEVPSQPPPPPPPIPSTSSRPMAIRSPSLPNSSSSSLASSKPASTAGPPALAAPLPPSSTMGSVSMRRANSAQTGNGSSGGGAMMPPPMRKAGSGTGGRGTPI